MDEVLRLFGFSFRPSVPVFMERYRELARKYHPDLNPDKQAAKMMKKINEGKTVFLAGVPSRTLEDKRVKQYVALLQHKLPPYHTLAQLDAVFKEELRNPEYKDLEKEALLTQAYNQVSNLASRRLQSQEFVRAHAMERIKEMAERSTMWDREQRTVQALREEASRIATAKLYNTWILRLKHLMKRVIRVKGKPKIPIGVRKRNKIITRLVAASAAMIIAILGGKYLWDHRTKTYLLIEAK